MIPPKGSIPRRKPKEPGDLLKGASSLLGDLTGELTGGVGNLLSGILKGLGKTLESVQNLKAGDLVKLVETQGNEEAKEKIKELKKILGEKGIGDLFSEGLDLGKLIDFAKKHGGEFTREFEIGGKKGVISQGIRIGGLGGSGRQPSEKFEVRRHNPKAPATKEKSMFDKKVQEPALDVFDEENHIKVVGDMPGVSEEDIKYELKGKILRIYTETTRRYEKEIELSLPVTEKVTLSYKNGVLEVTLTKK